MAMRHQPVLKNEVLEYLKPTPGENFIDCTFGFGGHSFAILEKIKPDGKVLGIEADEKEIEILEKGGLNERLVLVRGNFSDLRKIAQENNFSPVNGILFDLGFSSWQIEASGRGFSFQKDEPLDMRLDTRALMTAKQIVNSWPKEKLAEIFRENGEERYALRIADLIYQSRRRKEIETTSQLVEIIRKAVPFAYQRRKIPRSGKPQGGKHFATKTFQALRIAVNDELGNLEKALPQALELLEKGGRLAVISFQSLEDRLAKNFLREEKRKNTLKILTPKPVRPSLEEIRENPRSRSAKMRSAVKI
ncbi:MAG: 16S rRNA (cytosine(1402)-N(4))-methyltransferase [Candidatus Portnoybacteria bacterium CG10_big_fil_rev_8_21_14_0_10_43_39]|uniref:Ribosomal RNA small subunit methyltransferase H n=1 Tax=Candidatus Portnoybacteria bacterium CG10_big_fil_rev_8_21_14_0_10_43_39 TaxID=1974815 RepID=A0A2M8KI33_9BACT|nr:MAG: 16S rRNA (cytosine(1402)-N(4))-methyltransferase [Candidatus Portnoybacteria bacterium CG23_combo_of_CG06-09_8_20_14_all_44_36]PJE59575.1 MAG: 16S rRNA (cytosine(1402)-N(4))-methyltransferase [Candidatus Portnoybacteria bacterium CG10_big_fil_rev_8_21_14_0_10_43_39]